MRISSTIGAILFALPICRGTFFILDPPIHNADLNAQTVSPCGGYKLDSSEPRRDYPQNGLPLHMNSTESSGEWNFEYNSALKEDSWVSLGPDFKQHHTTDFCIPSMPISSDLVGEKGVIRVSQATANGQLFYLCFPVKFVKGSNNSLPDSCSSKNDDDSSTNSISSDALDGTVFHTAIDGHAKAVIIGVCVFVIVLFGVLTTLYALNRRRKKRQLETFDKGSMTSDEEDPKY